MRIDAKAYFKSRVKEVMLFLGLSVGALLIAMLVGNAGYVVGALIFAVLVAIPILYKSVIDTNFGFYFLTWYSYFLFFIARLLPVRLPMGVGVEVLELVLLAGIFIAESKRKARVDWTNFQNPITYIFIFLQTYYVLQAFNPNAVSINAWVVATRAIVFECIVYFLFVKILTRLDVVITYTKLWLFLSLLAAVYGIYQEVFGYADFEWRDIYSTPGTIFLIQNWGILRKFSFMSDVAAFGICMAYSAIFCAVLAMADCFDWKKRIVLFIAAFLMLVAMSFSGTRTATAMIPVGAFIYILMHINNRRTILILGVLVLGFMAILFGPFYGNTITRIRTTFQPKQDESMNVREINRARAQPLILSHPIGWGVNTTDSEGEALSPGHIFAGFPTDSGFLKTAITVGWIGLIILMTLYFSVLAIGVSNFYTATDPLVKALYGAYIAAFFSLVVANYAQSAMGQKPTGLLVFSIFVLMPNLIKLQRKQFL
ncbi:MAG: O-antigen ligase family protein [Bacteroidetes bacterium]|nr:O-antigen ligase family protein [Bacteroidota bacterium]